MSRFEDVFKPGIIVSCQAQPGEPLYKEHGGIMVLMAQAAFEAGAVGIRANGVVDVQQIIKSINLPLIAILKNHYENSDVFVTPTMKEVDELMSIKGVRTLAIDCTLRTRPHNESLEDFILNVKKKYSDVLIMADVSSLEEGIYAESLGVDAVATTLFGYTKESNRSVKPNIDIVKELVKHIEIPVVAEGGIYKEEHITEIFMSGAYAAVIGGAITRPKEIASRYVNAFNTVYQAQKKDVD